MASGVDLYRLVQEITLCGVETIQDILTTNLGPTVTKLIFKPIELNIEDNQFFG